MMKKENERLEDFNEIMELKEELDTDIKNLENSNKSKLLIIGRKNGRKR